jgi:hypothetical protein
MLTHFGDVNVLDPQKGFAAIRTLPRNPEASLQAPVKPGAPAAP